MLAPPWTGVIPDLTLTQMVDPGFVMTVMALMIIFTAGVFVFLLVRHTRDRHEFWVVRCPADGRQALVRVHLAPDGEYDVRSCSRFGTDIVTCDRPCMREAA
jgi:hypothetical protein